MMAGETVATRISILEKEFAVRCQPEDRGALQESARYLAERMAEAKANGRSLSHDRVTIMAALNITFEYLKLRQEKEALEAELNEGIHRIASKLALSSARRTPPPPVD